MRIVLVRHGQTAANRAHALDTGRPGLPLSPEGLEQAAGLADRWESEVAAPPLVLACSPLTRTPDRCAPRGALRARPPAATGHPRTALGRRRDEHGPLRRFRLRRGHRQLVERAPGVSQLDGGESGNEALARALPVVAEVAARVRAIDSEGVGAIVAHGAMIRLLASSLASNIEGRLVMTHFMGNTGTVVLECPEDLESDDPAALLGAFTALTWNDRPVGEWDY